MNNYKIILSILFIAVGSLLNAQTYQDVLRYSQPQYSGTARSVAMGGAFGSLGGDFSALSINPAGIATYRSSEISITPSIILNSTKSTINSPSMEDDKTSFAMNQIGFVGTYRPMREVKKGIASTHFAIGYNRNNNFNYRTMAAVRNADYSVTDLITFNSKGFFPDELSGISMLAYESYLTDFNDIDTSYTSYLEYGDLVNQTRIIDKDGYSGEINITVGTNISNILLIGVSLNFTMLNYEEETKYFEQYSENNPKNLSTFNRYSVSDYLEASGNGVNLKIGFILKPMDKLRIGAAYHTPTWYNIEEEYGSRIDGIFFENLPDINTNETFANYDGRYDYNFNTPDKFIASTSYVFGKIAIVSFDYEYINYANAKFRTTQDTFEDISFIADQNDMIDETFTNTNNFRAGAEFRLNKQISLRGGYAFQASPYKYDPKDNEIITYSAGLGFRSKNHFIDVAYKLSTYDVINFDEIHYLLPEPETETKDHNIVLTFGLKF
jgi:long-subunit fatty acid transport protein